MKKHYNFYTWLKSLFRKLYEYKLTLSQLRIYNLQVHHWNRNPRDNRKENLVADAIFTTIGVGSRIVTGAVIVVESQPQVRYETPNLQPYPHQNPKTQPL
ncbi:HNH endonuclease [Calothrix sp. NIES-4101]|nr:HNH endonuclease [Calothrix sp. NIES-4101]